MAVSNILSLQPSAAHRWMHCTASPQFIASHAAELPDDSSPFADEGAMAHEIAEKMLLGQDFMGPPDMVEHVKGYVDRVRANLATSNGGKLFVETKVALFYMPARTGRTDTAILDPQDLIIRDYKNGEGVVVEAVNNEQLAIYGESFIRQECPTFNGNVRLVIDQPRAREGDTVKSWDLTRQELGLFTARIGAVARKIIAGEDTVFEPGSACRFCPAKGICPALGKEALMVLPEEAVVELGGLPAPEGLSEGQVGRILSAKKQLEDWLEAVETRVWGILNDGGTFPGYKLVEGRSNKIWVDEALAAKKLAPFIGKDALYSEPKLLTPTQAEKLLKKPLKPLTTRLQNALDDLILRPAGKPVLAPESDSRPAINQNQIAGFLDETLL